MSFITAFLAAFLTLNISVLTGAGVATFQQPIAPLKAQAIRVGFLSGAAVLIALIAQISTLTVLIPLLALASTYIIATLEAKVLNFDAKVELPTLIATGGAITMFAVYASAYAPTTPTFYMAILGMVSTYAVTLAILQLLQRRLRLANVPKPMRNVPLLAVTLALLAIVLTGFTAIF